MPYGSVLLLPGVNVQQTPTLLTTSVSRAQLIRYRDSLVQKYGGWQTFFASTGGVPRDLHAWQDLNQTDHLAAGTTTQLAVITSGALQDITPQTLTSDFSPNFSTTSGSAVVEVIDANISNVTNYDSVFFNTAISIGGLILSGLYAILQSTGTHSYDITAASNATSTVPNAGAVPQFTTTSGTNLVSVLLANHGLADTDTATFPISTTGNGVTISGDYNVVSVADANNFTISASTQATASSSFNMNGGSAEIVYYINLGPPAAGSGYGLGAYGSGGYGTGVVGGQQSGTPITATDWTTDNWGEVLIACPSNGGVYQFDPTGGFTNAGLVSSAPPFNAGIFISTSEEILVCYGSTQSVGVGVERNPLLVKWSALGDYTDFVPTDINQAGSYPIPTGSRIVGGIAVTNQNLIWTDLDCWAMNYLGTPFVYGFNKIGSGAGLISSHAAQPLRGNIYWMGSQNFYSYTSSGVAVLPCPVWDFVFQNLNTAYAANVRAMPNTPFNEAGWEFPSTASTSGENDSYVKMNITEPNAPWDYGSLSRSAWIDQSVLGMPIAATAGGVIYKHETTSDADGQPMLSSFTTGYFFISPEGEQYAFVDQILPDFRWGFFGAAQTAQIEMTFSVVNFPGDTPAVYGPYTVVQGTEYISVRFRGRQMQITISSSDLGSWWRIGRVRYRYAPAGRR